MPGHPQSIDELSINTIRLLAADMAEKANSGHPGLPMGAAPMGYVLFKNHIVLDPQDTSWPNRDRFVLSPGHGSALQYALMHLTGFDLSLDELRDFRQWGSRTAGHPEFGLLPGVECTTGPLGQGAANAVGMAIAERMLAHRFNRPGHAIVDHVTYAIVSDGDLMEGVSAEAASLAGQLGLGKLICLYDSNDVTLDGPTSITFSVEDVRKRYEAYGWQVLNVNDGDTDYASLDAALHAARADLSRPSMIVVKTTIGFGSPNKQGKSASHGAPLGPDELALTKQQLGWDPQQSFVVRPDVAEHCRRCMDRGRAARKAWEERFEAYSKEFPELAAAWHDTLAGVLPEGWDSDLPCFEVGDRQPTRSASGKALNAIARRVPWLVGGDADIGSSTKSQIKDGGSFDGRTGAGRNIHFGVREHAMTSIANGMAYHGGVRPLVSTFFTFVDYMRPAIRVAALARLPLLLVFSHDSLAVGEDGPTHQPVEQLQSLRLMPNVVVLRPADPNESVEAWRWAMQYREGPVALIFTRQKVPVLDREQCAPACGLQKGAYVLRDAEGETPDVVVIATGSEVSLALEAQTQLAADGLHVRVVSMPSWELFARQPTEYRREVLPAGIPRVAVEAGVRFGWERWVGNGEIVGCDRYGSSAPGHVAMEKLGFNVENVKAAIRRAAGKA